MLKVKLDNGGEDYMAIINKAKETMTSKERVLKTFNFEKTDRVPIDYSANAGIHHRLIKALGIKGENYNDVLDALGVDFRGIHPKYKGPKLFKEISGTSVDPVYGHYTRWIEHPSGGYMDFCNFPLANASDEDIENYPVPEADHFDYDELEPLVYRFKDYATYIGSPGIPDIINSMGRIMNMENILMNLILEHEATYALLNRKIDMELGVLERTLAKYKGKIDFMWLGEDLGTQNSPMISLELYRKAFRPIHQRFIDLAKAYNLPVMIHTCGSSSWVYEDFIEMGINAVDTLQPEAKNMSPKYLKEHFGGRLSFHGCISTAGPLAYGSVKEVIENCRETLDIMMPGYGYHFAPTHSIQDNSPVENVIAMYQTAHDHGIYK
jgi:uroporphyrinogen decarboxylase